MRGNRIRQPAVAGQFYEGTAAALERAVKACAGGFSPPEDLGMVVGGVVPHAGWMFSGPTAAKVFKTLALAARPEVFVLMGAVHQWGVGAAAVYDEGAWATPLGEIAVDSELAEAILSAAGKLAGASRSAHEGEHSIEVQLPFIQVLSPGAHRPSER